MQRAAANQAHTVFQMLEEHWEEKAGKTFHEQDEKASARLLNRLAKEPRPITAYLRSHPSRQHRRPAIAVLEGVTVLADGDGKTVKIRGVGTFVLEDRVHEPIRSAPRWSSTGTGCGSTPSTGHGSRTQSPWMAPSPATTQASPTP